MTGRHGRFQRGSNNRAHGQGDLCCIVETFESLSCLTILVVGSLEARSVVSFPRARHSAHLLAQPLRLETGIKSFVFSAAPGFPARCCQVLYRQLSLFGVAKLIPSPQAELRRIPDLSKL